MENMIRDQAEILNKEKLQYWKIYTPFSVAFIMSI